MSDTMEVTRAFLEQKFLELGKELLEADPMNRTLILKRMRILDEAREEYNSLCLRCQNAFSSNAGVDIIVTGGAIRDNYINLHKAIELGLLRANSTVVISFPDIGLEKCCCQIKGNGFLRSRTIASAFYKGHDPEKGLSFRITKDAEGEYTIVKFETISLPKRLMVERHSPFRFSQWGLKPGDTLTCCVDPTISCVILDDRHVEYEGHRYSLTKLWQDLTGRTSATSPGRYFSYQGIKLADIPIVKQRKEVCEE